MTLKGRHFEWSGVAAGAAAWALSTQGAYVLVPLACSMRLALTVPLTICCVIVALAGAWLSYGTHRGSAAEWQDTVGGHAARFVAWVASGAGILFALAIINQAAASLIIDGCLR